MTPRQRLFAALNGEATDHVPVWLLFPYHKMSCYADVRAEPSYRAVFEASLKCAITLNRRHLGVRTFAPEVKQWDESRREGEGTVRRQHVEWKGKRIFSETRESPDGTRVKHLLSSDDDLEFYCSLPLNQDPVAIRRELDGQLPGYAKEKEEFPEDLGAMMLDPGEPIGPLYGASDMESYAVWSLTHSDLIVRFLDRRLEQLRTVYGYFLDRRLADLYFLVGSELASPPLVSRHTFQRWIVPYASDLIARIHAAGAKVIQHYHGQIRDILPDFLTMKPDGLHTIESPPVGNCLLSEALDVVGGRIALIGNIQYDEFRRLSPGEMAAAARSVLDEARGRPLILSPTAGPYEATLSLGMAENYLTFLRTAWEYPWNRRTES